MNKQTDQEILESLFSQARGSQPALDDASFSARVMEDFPFEQQLAHNTEQLAKISANLIPPKKSRKVNWVDLAGLSLGLLACFSLIEPSQILSLVANSLPEKLVLSPVTIFGTSIAMAGLAFSAWYVLEGESSL